MKKRCTNSSCRRVFRMPAAENEPCACPFCGKLYRGGKTVAEYRVAVELSNLPSGSGLQLIKLVAQMKGLNFLTFARCWLKPGREAKGLVEIPFGLNAEECGRLEQLLRERELRYRITRV